MVSTSLMVDTIPVPPRPILLCALNCALTIDRPQSWEATMLAAGFTRADLAHHRRISAIEPGTRWWELMMSEMANRKEKAERSAVRAIAALKAAVGDE